MMPMTPSGTRTRWMRSPFGRVHSAATVPIGSGSASTSSSPRAIASTRPASSCSRSSSAPLSAARPAPSRRSSRVGGENRGAARADGGGRRLERGVLAGAVASASAQRSGGADRRPCTSRVHQPRRSAARMVTASQSLAQRRAPPRQPGAMIMLQKHQIVTMDQLIAAAKAQEPLDLGALAAHDARRVAVGIGDDAARDLGAVGGQDADGVAALEAARACRSRRPAAGSCPRAARAAHRRRCVIAPAGRSVPAIHCLRAASGVDAGTNQVQRAPSSRRRSGWRWWPAAMHMWQPAATAMRAASDLGRHAARADLETLRARPWPRFPA